ncbi:MAG: YebC/PmpR family DNA-binding transcriptional regulator [Verrucomicrobia bacterium]|nr:YebC/PmpR family DNA-binding transcriptional regulator [Verrucomicrobiota bacterium]MBU6446324.1 YebC/PmpR family DNA-binding transcriptional regulator [Verrucomicrobiota bacterium]
MAGHSKWANIKHRKERADKKKGKVFSRIMKEIISAVKQGGPDPKSNSKLKIAIQKAKDANVPNDNVERNIKKAASSDSQDYTSMTYELYGYGGVGLIVDIMTDNKNRISSDIRIATNKCGGTVATPGAVAYNFDRKGVIKVAKSGANEDDLFLLVSEQGADDFSVEDESFVITTPIEAFNAVKEALQAAGAKIEEAELAMVPKTWVAVNDQDADSNITLIEWLENLDDVDAVYHNMKI